MTAAYADADGTISEINMTPLIDVMLVLLVMFIITIPLQTDAVKIDLPTDCANCPRVERLKNVVVILPDDRILWNGAPVGKRELAATLADAARIAPQPELHLQPHSEARYETVDEVLAITKRAGVTNMGFVGNEAYLDF